MKQQSPHILYICHDGVIPPLGQSQVLNLLLELRRSGNLRLSLLSFEKPSDLLAPALATTQSKLEEAGIDWTILRYHRHPTGFATLFDVIHGFCRGLLLARRHGTSLVHGRSYVSTSIALLLKWFARLPYIFDMRGFWADEKVDVGTITKRSLSYRAAKLAEGILLRNADVIASLSKAGIEEMQNWPACRGLDDRFAVVTTYTNLELFKGETRPASEQPFTVGYVGGAQGWYLIDPFLEVFRCVLAQMPDARLLILNRYDHEFLRQKISEHGIPEGSIELKAVEHDNVAAEMARMHCAAFFIRPSYSKIASAPTKMGELLACGIPCLTNTGVGDVETILRDSGAGITVKGFSREEIEEGTRQLIALAKSPNAAVLCRSAAEQYFSLENGAYVYRQTYTNLLDRKKSLPSL